MSREIKFRVWNGEMMSEVFAPWQMKRDVTGGWMDSQGCGLWYPGCEAHNVQWMQFTGLKDHHGVEIYEGDVCGIVYNNDEGGGWHSNKKLRGAVYFDEFWGVKFDCKDYTQRTAEAHWGRVGSRDCLKIEVLGNIHQHPELLSARGEVTP